MKRYESYKPSGVSWIGEIPSHWEQSTLRKHLALISEKGYGDKQLLSVTRELGVIVRNTEDKEENHNYIPDDLNGYKLVKQGQFVINKMKSWQGSYGVSDFEGIVSPAYYVCNLDFSFKPFFSMAIRSKAYIPFFSQMSKGIRVDQWDLSTFALKSIPFFIPPLDEQKKIVEFLSSKTAKIDALQAEREKEMRLLEELKQAEIANVVTRGLNPDVPMKDSGIPWIGQIPAHWEVKRLGAFFNDNISSNSEYKFDRAYKFNYGTIVPKNEIGDVSDLRETYLKYSVLKQDDIIINGLNLNYDFVSQRVAISPTDCIITSAYIVLRPASNTYSQYFLQLFKAMDSKKLFHGMGTGIRLTLSFNELKSQILPIPPIEEQRAIVKYIEQKNKAIDDMIANLRAEIDFLTEYKQRLIADAVTGQIKID